MAFMLPEITEALLTRAIQTPRMLSAGRDYWRQGLVRDVRVDHEGGVVQSAVKGTGPTPYRVELRLGVGTNPTATCSCPVGIGCKHAAATLFAVQQIQRAENASGAGVRRSMPPQDSLPPVLAQWAAAMRPLAERLGAVEAGSSRAILYIVRAQAAVGTVKLSKKHPLASLAPAGCSSRLLIEAVDVVVDEAGKPVSLTASQISGFEVVHLRSRDIAPIFEQVRRSVFYAASRLSSWCGARV